MTELNLNMNRYRECARHVWNTYFRGQSNSEDLFLNVEYELFYALVLAPSGLEGGHKSPFDVPLPFLRVVPNPSLRVLSVMIAPPGGPDSNVYWKEVELEPGDLELRFIDFFDWANPDDFRDYQYVRARIVASHVGENEDGRYKGHDILLPAMYVQYEVVVDTQESRHSHCDWAGSDGPPAG